MLCFVSPAMRMLPVGSPWRLPVIVLYALGALILIVVVAIAAFPLGTLRPMLERRLSERFGRPVTIAALERREPFSLHPTVAIRGIRVPQARWAGTGDLATIDTLEVRISAMELLRARIVPDAITLRGARIVLVRDAAGRENWHGDAPDTPSRDTPAIERLTIADTRIVYRDARQDRSAQIAVTSDAATGFRASGSGTVRSAPVAIAARGAAIGVERRGVRWPFRVAIDGADLAIAATGTMAAPFDTDHMALDVTARAADLKLIDAVIEAGLFRTQPVRLAAHVVRASPRWTITALTGTVGRSRLAGALTVDKAAGRTALDGDIRFATLDFGDLSSDEGQARAAAKTRAIGPRIVPDTRVNLAKIDTTDAVLRIKVDRVLGVPELRSLATTLTLDRQRLVADPLRARLPEGVIEGRAVVDQRGGARVPLVTLDLALKDSSVAALSGGSPVPGDIAARVDARVRLTGRGDTLRAAVARSRGRIGFAARDGSLPAKYAAALGFDMGAALTEGDGRAALRCVVVGLDVTGGIARTRRFVIDTSRSRLDGTGTIRFPPEVIAVRLTGAPKREALLRIPGTVTLGGTLSSPALTIPPQVKSVGNIFKAIGNAITGREGPVAADADCGTLVAGVLR